MDPLPEARGDGALTALEMPLLWIAQAMTGSVATGVAILAVGALGFAMLQGRVPARRGASVLVGCFVLFSASTIAVALVGAAKPLPFASVESTPVPPPAILPDASRRPTVDVDPYAGAAVPNVTGAAHDIFSK